MKRIVQKNNKRTLELKANPFSYKNSKETTKKEVKVDIKDLGNGYGYFVIDCIKNIEKMVDESDFTLEEYKKLERKLDILQSKVCDKQRDFSEYWDNL